jgi:hypothetical protein
MIFKIQFLSQRKQYFFFAKIRWFLLSMEIIAIYFENHMKPLNVLCGQNADLFIAGAGAMYSYHRASRG